jgi:hypothetical protein
VSLGGRYRSEDVAVVVLDESANELTEEEHVLIL